MNLRGIIIRNDDNSVIVRATPADVATFVTHPDPHVVLQHQSMGMTYDAAIAIVQQAGHERWREVRPGDTLYLDNGQPVAQVTDVLVHREMGDVSAFGGRSRWTIRCRISAEGL